MMNRRNRICTLNLSAPPVSPSGAHYSPAYDRLKKAMAQFEDILAMRSITNNCLFGKFMEDRLIWRELLELELQDVEEQIERICTGVVSPADSQYRPS